MTVLLDGRPLDSVPVDEEGSPYPAALYTGQDVVESTATGVLER